MSGNLRIPSKIVFNVVVSGSKIVTMLMTTTMTILMIILESLQSLQCCRVRSKDGDGDDNDDGDDVDDNLGILPKIVLNVLLPGLASLLKAAKLGRVQAPEDPDQCNGYMADHHKESK